jgi:hypothetical protein
LWERVAPKAELVMAGLDPAIHVLEPGSLGREKDVDARHKAGHDDKIVST